MERFTGFLLAERLVYLALVAGLQLNVLREGHRFARQVQSVVSLPGLRDEGTVLGRNDLSDYQWRSFRDAVPLLSVALVGFLALARLARCFPGSRQVLMVALSLAFLGALHGACAVYVLALTTGAYGISRLLADKPYGILVVWGYCCGTLLLARLSEGLPFAWISPTLEPLDRHRGLLRWHIHYNLLVLRCISFAADLRWARDGKRQQRNDSKDGGGGDSGGGSGGTSAGSLDLELGALAEQSLPLPYYSLMPYLEYVLYPPLYIAGPTITFNSFAAQRMLRRQPLLRPRQVVLYGLRLALVWSCLELLTHLLPYNSIAKHRVLDWLAAAAPAAGSSASGGGGGWPTPRPLHYAITGFWVLLFMWLKFTVLWRFFRLVAMADGVVPLENMTRCVCDNYDIEGFWRSWHASYNRWLVRYMYIPLGGRRWRAINVWVIFTFVALWHDLEWRLLGWAWLMAGAIAPEMLVKALGRSPALRRWRGSAAFRHAAALAAALNILMLMAANLVGFVVGVDGIRPLAIKVLGQPRFLAVVLLALFSAAQLMFWKREFEAGATRASTRAGAGVDVGVGTSSGSGGGGGRPACDGGPATSSAADGTCSGSGGGGGGGGRALTL